MLIPFQDDSKEWSITNNHHKRCYQRDMSMVENELERYIKQNRAA